MNTPLDDLMPALRCPSCRDGGLGDAGESGDWLACTDCATRFSRIDGIGFLVTPEFATMLRQEDLAETGEGEHDDLDADTVVLANAAYHDKFADQYEDDVTTYDMFMQGGNCQRRIKVTLEAAAARSQGGRLLDVCCGTGNILLAGRSLFKHALGIDISTGMMGIARSRGLETLGADTTNIPLRDESIDCVTCFSALHHMVDYAAVAAEMARVLKPGGTFFTDWDPNGHVTHTGWAVKLAVEFLKTLRRLVSKGQIPETAEQKTAEYHHFSKAGFDAEQVARVLRDAGFRKVEVIYHLNPPHFEQANGWNAYLVLMAILKTLSFIPPVRGNICPWVAVRAEK